jgi:hypothetical protein
MTLIVIRKRRSRRHRRNRKVRRALLLFVCASFTLAFSGIALRYLSPALFHEARNAEPDRKSVEASRNLFLASQKEALRQLEGRTVYKYGGVRSVQELKRAAELDPVVAGHNAGFNYDRGRVVRLVLARTAYVSYRIGNKVYWTLRRVSLKKGEPVITDGRMTARTRCANRVEEMPQQAASEVEPLAATFGEPVQPQLGTAMTAPPVPFQSALVDRNPAPGLGPSLPLGSCDPIANGAIIPILPAPMPGVCGIGTKKEHGDTAIVGPVQLSENGKKKKLDPCGEVGVAAGQVPEPGTWLLMGSGVAGPFWRAHNKLSRTSLPAE